MSYNGYSGYSNGYRPQEQRNRYGDSGQDEDSTRGSQRSPRTRRAGGYGGFAGADVAEQPELTDNGHALSVDSPDPYETSSVPTWRRGHTRDHSESRERKTANGDGLRPYGSGQGAKQIEGVVQHINDNWSILTKSDCVPVYIALQLMDYSSLGRGNDYDDFKYTNSNLQKALRTIVNEHHQGFNSSIGTFHKIQSSIQASQNRVRALKGYLLNAKTNLTVAKPELKGLAALSMDYDEMLQVLGQIERIHLMPEQLEISISDKHFLTAVQTLQDALRLVRHSNLENIGALADLKVYLHNQEISLTDILVEELHDHLYLKSPYCSDRWKVFCPNPNDLPGSSMFEIPERTEVQSLYKFLADLSTSSPMADDASRNPESNSFEYIHMILEALNNMGHLDLAVESIDQRLPVELFAVVERTNHEVDLRHPAHPRGSHYNHLHGTIPNLVSDSVGGNNVLPDLLYTLYSKFEAIAEGHRAVHAIILGIVEREGLRKTDTLTRGFKEMWKLYQSEMRSLLHDYLATDGSQLDSTRRASVADASIFHRGQRDKTKQLFKLEETNNLSKDLASEQDDLDRILKASVPGLVSKSFRRSGANQSDRTIHYDAPRAGHKLLIEPSVFNISLLLPPSLSFLQRLKDIVPPDSDIAVSTLTSFLDDFLVNVFSPQLDETVTDFCTRSFIDIDAYEQDSHWADHALRPVFKGTSQFFFQIKVFCKVVLNIPQDHTFTQLIVTQLRTYYEKCSTWYRSLVSRANIEGGTRLKAAAAMVASGDLSVTCKTIWEGEISDRERLMQKEAEMLVAQTNEVSLEPFDIISDPRSVTSLCLLYSSMQWLSTQLEGLRQLASKGVATQDSRTSRQSRRWTSANFVSQQDSTLPVQLFMTHDTAAPFDNIISAYRELAVTALLTLHLDIRCGMIHMLSRTLRAPYSLQQPVNEPDESIISLNADLLNFDDTLIVHLPEQEYTFITSGLGLLLDHMLITNASQISLMNQNGCDWMQLNILVLQQNLKSIEKSVALTRSAQFFDYFSQGADTVVAKAKENGGKEIGFKLEELKVLVELCYSEALKSPQRDVAAQARRTLSDHLLQLSESMWDS